MWLWLSFSLLYVGFQSLNIPLDVPLTITVFCGTIMSYNFIKYGESATYYFRVTKKAFVPIQILSVLAGFLEPMVYLNCQILAMGF